MTRYMLVIEYDGGPYCGWQRQENGPSVQAAVEDAIHGFSGQQVRLTVAGRTDAGVHALGQVAHMDLAGDHAPDTVRDAINAHLRPQPVSVRQARVVPADFSARTDALRRRYRYRILNRMAPPALARGQVWQVKTPLDARAMQEAARHLLGHHDFTSFRAADCQANSPLRTLDRLDVLRDGDMVEIHAMARSFLHHQIRNFAGTLVEVGRHRHPPIWLKEVLEARDRAAAGPTAPPGGLTFMAVDYPAERLLT